MENNSLFDLRVDENATSYLSEAARWAKFLAIVGFIFAGLIILLGLFGGAVMSALTAGVAGGMAQEGAMQGGIFVMIMYTGMGIVVGFVAFYMFRFSVRIKTALASGDQDTLNDGLGNLKSMFKLQGVITIIYLVLMAIGVVFGIMAGAMFLQNT
ncbi:DUF5362 family protein [Chitinophaga lutea]